MSRFIFLLIYFQLSQNLGLNLKLTLDLTIDNLNPQPSTLNPQPSTAAQHEASHELMEATCALYGLIHARYVLTTGGLEAMCAKYTRQVRKIGQIDRGLTDHRSDRSNPVSIHAIDAQLELEGRDVVF